ncbi:hypothetical protein [Spiroplasma endosymbiont of Asaphidion curtum]
MHLTLQFGNKKIGLEQKIWASKSAVESVRTDLVGDNWLCVNIAY